MGRAGKNVTCLICGKVCRPGGIGGHVRLKHGLNMKTMVMRVSDVRGDVRDVPGDVRDVPGEVSDVRGEVSDIRVQRPSDPIGKNEVVVDSCVEPIGDPENYGPGKQGRNIWGQTWDQRETQKRKDLKAAERWLYDLLTGKPT